VNRCSLLNMVRYALDQDKKQNGDGRNDDEDRDKEPEPMLPLSNFMHDLPWW